MNTTPRFNIDTCAMLVEFNASVWTARKLDKSTTDEVTSNKNAAKDAARVNKHLLAGRTELEVIQQAVGRARQYVYDNTSPWSDSGLRLLPNTRFIKFAERMNEFDEEIAALVKAFIVIYPSLITAQAMALGDMFRRDDFPTPNDLVTKFSFRVNYMPVPTAGDFRVDVGNKAQEELKAKLEALTQERIDHAMADVRARLGERLKRISDRLTTDYVQGEAKTRRFHDTLVDGALEMCDLAKSLNIINDPALETARRDLEQVLLMVSHQLSYVRTRLCVKMSRRMLTQYLSKFSF
jgi:hypothetical protein